jgi:hypothetical protein
MEEKKERFMPVLHKDQYYISENNTALTPDEKAQFLEMYYKTGNLTKSAQFLGRDRMAFSQHLDKDKAFAVDFYNVKQAIKNDLEETMMTNGLKEKGYMDRITWLRTNYPQEYNPNADRSADDRSQEAIKQLSEKLNEYELIPKRHITEPEKDK